MVHVCTPPRAHFDAAAAALDGGAHVYVEKPFALTERDARSLLELARARGRIVCAGHQLLRDAAFEALLIGAGRLGSIVQVDSHFAFRPAGAGAAHQSARALVDQLLDILPHPLYTLVAALERFGPPGAAVGIEWASCGPSDLQAILRAGDVVGRLSVSLRARPIASSITLVGTQGSLSCDFVRSIVVGAANPGIAALEKVLNPVVEGIAARVADADQRRTPAPDRRALSRVSRKCSTGSTARSCRAARRRCPPNTWFASAVSSKRSPIASAPRRPRPAPVRLRRRRGLRSGRWWW